MSAHGFEEQRLGLVIAGHWMLQREVPHAHDRITTLHLHEKRAAPPFKVERCVSLEAHLDGYLFAADLELAANIIIVGMNYPAMLNRFRMVCLQNLQVLDREVHVEPWDP